MVRVWTGILVRSAMLAIRVAEVERCPISMSQLHFARDFTQSRKLRAWKAVSALPFADLGSIAAFE